MVYVGNVAAIGVTAFEAELGVLPVAAPVIYVRGIAYKGTVEITTRPPERQAIRG